MLINRISKALCCLLLLSFFSCESVKEIDPQNLGIINEQELLPVDQSFEEMDEGDESLELMTSEDCNRLARIRYARIEGACSLFFQVRGKYFLSPINMVEFVGNFPNGGIVKIGFDRVEVGNCDRGIPIILNCVEKIGTRRAFEERGTINFDRDRRDGN